MTPPENNCRYFQIAGMTICVQSDLDFDTIRFKPELEAFAVQAPGDDTVTLHHRFELPDLEGQDLGVELYHRAPWLISRQGDTWYYRSLPEVLGRPYYRFAIFTADHTQATIYSPPSILLERIQVEDWQALSLFPTDQIWLIPLLADRQAVLLHSAAAILNGQGLLFVGHSDAGKSTTMTLLKDAGMGAEILCDDRNIVRKWDEVQDLTGFRRTQSGRTLSGLHGWRVHGTWSHGDVADVSPASAPLRAILFLEQSPHNQIVPLTDRKEIWKRLLATLIRALVTAEWWHKQLDVLEGIVDEVPCYLMQFDKTGAIVPLLEELTKERNNER